MAPDPSSGARPGRFAGASAPGKCILMGEHAVVYGAPCLSLAVDLRTEVTVERDGVALGARGAPAPTVDGFLVSALRQVAPEGPDVTFHTRSGIPQASGLGSSAALTVAATAALFALASPAPLGRVAQVAFAAERAAQGGGSPNDTSVATAGGAVLLAPERHQDAGLRHLWTITHDDLVWEVHQARLPKLGLVVGHTGVRSLTGDQVAKVRRFVEGDAQGRATVETVGDLVWRTLDALRADDLETTGKLMVQGQSALDRMGAGHPALDALLGSVAKAEGTLGAKLTGAGGGGSIVVLTRDPQAASEAIRTAGGTPYIVTSTEDGVRTALATEVGA